jgi:predicted amidophosphoribosyltransferase
MRIPALGPGQCYVSDADYRRHFGEQTPTESCPDCGGEMTRGAERCRSCQRKVDEFDDNAGDPRRV